MGNILWMASYPKSGNTWVRAFLHNYLNDGDGPSDINRLEGLFASESSPRWYRPLVKGDVMSLDLAAICRLRPQVHRQIAASRAGTVMVKTHNFLGEVQGQPLHEMAVTSGAVVMVRNPLDVVLSLADHFGLSLDEAIAFMGDPMTGSPSEESNVASALGSWSFNVDSWTRDQSGSTHVLRYEDLLDNPRREFGRLLDFLRLPREAGRLKRALEHASFGKLQALEQQQGFREKSPHSQRFFRSGRKHQWPGKLTEAQVAALVRDHHQVMSRHGYLTPALARYAPSTG